MSVLRAPDSMPVLSPGRHRNQAKGACFMEMASYLAGERWSDHPRCTHPLLAELARYVNDLTGDDQRQRLGPMIPSVVGLTSDDVRMDATIALRSAQRALPLALDARRHTLAISVLTSDHVLAVLDDRPVDQLLAESRRALDATPKAAASACEFFREMGVSMRGFRKYAAPSAVRVAVVSIRDTAVTDPGAALVSLLADVIADCQRLLSTDQRRPERDGELLHVESRRATA